MYRGVLTTTSTEQELNKPYIAPEEQEDLSTPSYLQKRAVNTTQDDWNKVMEDPLLQIRQTEQDTMRMIAKNPLKMKEILHLLQKREHKSKKDKKSSHKSKKRDRKVLSPSPRDDTDRKSVV